MLPLYSRQTIIRFADIVFSRVFILLFAFFFAAGIPFENAKAGDDSGKADVVELDCGYGVMLKMVKIPAGTFMMGSPESEEGRSNNEVQHRVTISKSFYIGVHEVTQAQYQAVMGANRRYVGDVNHPVVNVSWNYAMEFCRKLSAKTGRKVRLPTEAEWEYACRAGTTTAFYNGSDPEMLVQVGNISNGGSKAAIIIWNLFEFGESDGYGMKTVPVGKFKPNAWGLYDMHGNVWEWCWDWYGSYSSGAQTDPTGASSGSYRVRRGGSWYYFASGLRSEYRIYDNLYDRYGVIGFRLVRP
jgi:formylglycine-generating enzyme required for sulfatase activity